MKIPFYMDWSSYTSWLNTNFASLQLNDNVKFIGFIFLNVALLFLLIEIIRILKFLVLLIKNCIYR